MRLTVQPHIVGKHVPSEYMYARGWENRDWSIEEITSHISVGGVVCVASITGEDDGYRDEDHFVSAQIIGLDFDSGPSVEYFWREDPFVKQHAFYVGATSRSTKDAPRTRVLFALDQPVTDPNRYRRLVLKMLNKYQHLQPDLKCKDPVRIFFGSTVTPRKTKAGVLPISVLEALPDPAPLTASGTGSNEDYRPLSAVLEMGANTGDRNTDALRLVGYFANFMSADQISAIMKMWYDAKVPNKRDFDYSIIESMIRRMAEKSAPVYEKVREVLEKGQSTPQPIVAASDAFKTSSFASFIGGEDEAIKWVIQDWLPEATTGGITAPPESYKTWLAMALAVSAATGEPFLGKYQTYKRIPVLIIQQEDSKGLLRQRLRVIYSELWRNKPVVIEKDLIKFPVCTPDIHIFEGAQTFRFDNAEMMSNLKQYVQQHGIKLVILDPLYSATDSSDYMAKDAQRMVELKRMRDQSGCSFMFVHHTKKTLAGDDSGKVNRQDSWGSQFINAWLEFGIQIRQKGNGMFAIRRHFKSEAATEQQVMRVDISTKPEDYHFSMTIEDDDNSTLEENYEEQIMTVVKAAPTAKLSGSKIAAALKKSPSWVSDGVGKKSLDSLVKQGRLRVDKSGNAKVYVATEIADF